MEAVWEWGINVIQAIQTVTCKPLDAIAFFIHYVFNMPIYLFCILLYCWCIDTKKGFRIGTTLLVSCHFNASLKSWLKAPRPYQYSSANFDASTYQPGKGIADYSDSPVFRIEENGYSTPSGHSQTAGTFWPMFAQVLPISKNANTTERKLAVAGKIILAILVPFTVAISRNYLGVHYPTDVIGGVLIGFLFAATAMIFGNKIEALFAKVPKIFRILIVAGVTVVMNFMCLKDTSMSGAFFGFVIGHILMDDGKRFEAKEGTWWQKLLRFIIGALILGIVYIGLKKLFNLFAPNGSSMYQVCRFLRYGLCGFIITYAAPMLFMVMGLAKPINKD